MNQALSSADTHAGSRRFILEMLGFSDAEKEMLASTFRLTGQRKFCYTEPNAPNERGDVYLVNADSPEGLKQLKICSPSVHVPAVLIGREQALAGWPQLPKPIRWMRLFELLDQTMQAALSARARRPRSGSAQWDGHTGRRAVDGRCAPLAAPAPMAATRKSLESILVVDDSATVRAFMRIKLAPFGFAIDYAESGETALRMARKKRYSCIFLDIVMPGIDGYQVCKRIKTHPATRNTPVIMLTARSSAFDKFRGGWAGCDAYLSKHGSEDELLMTIARVLPSARKVAKTLRTAHADVSAPLL